MDTSTTPSRPDGLALSPLSVVAELITFVLLNSLVSISLLDAPRNLAAATPATIWYLIFSWCAAATAFFALCLGDFVQPRPRRIVAWQARRQIVRTPLSQLFANPNHTITPATLLAFAFTIAGFLAYIAFGYLGK